MAKTKIDPNNPAFQNTTCAEQVFTASCKLVAWLAVALKLRASAEAIFQQEMPAAARHWDEFRRVSDLISSGIASPKETDVDEKKFPL